jgi:hypothetical protein
VGPNDRNVAVVPGRIWDRIRDRGGIVAQLLAVAETEGARGVEALFGHHRGDGPAMTDDFDDGSEILTSGSEPPPMPSTRPNSCSALCGGTCSGAENDRDSPGPLTAIMEEGPKGFWRFRTILPHVPVAR